MDLPALFVIGFDFMLAAVHAILIATLVVKGRISRDQQTLETAYMTECVAMVMRGTFVC